MCLLSRFLPYMSNRLLYHFSMGEEIIEPPKLIFCHLLTLMSFQNCMTFFLLWNTKKKIIWKMSFFVQNKESQWGLKFFCTNLSNEINPDSRFLKICLYEA